MKAHGRGVTAVLLIVPGAAALLPVAASAFARTHQSAPAPPASTCPNDVVAWVNTDTGIIQLPGMRWYGRSEQGEYMCRKDALWKGYHQIRSGR